MRFMLTSSGSSVTQGPHQVAQTLINRSFFDGFATSLRMPSASIAPSVTSSLFHRSSDSWTESRLSDHLMEQPKVRVVSTGAGRPASRASIALRVSGDVTRCGLSELSIRPANRSLRASSKMNTWGVATGP